MKKNFWKKTAAGLMALLIVAGASPVAPFSQVFERSAITASADGDEDDGFTTVTTAEEFVDAFTEEKDGKKIRLGDDIYYYDSSLAYYGADGVLDLNGHTLYVMQIGIGENCSLTVEDSGEGGKIEYYYNSECTIMLYCGGKLTLNSGTIEYPKSEDNEYCAIDVFNGTLIINGGTVAGDYSIWRDHSEDNIIINGGNIVGGFRESGGSLTITGGTFSFDPSTYTDNFTFDLAHYKVNDNGDDTYTVEKMPKTITIDESVSNGTVTADKTSAAEGDTVTLTVTPDEGYSVGSVSVKDTDNEDVELTDYHDGTYSFTMPAKDVTVSATFMQNVIPVYREVKLTFDSNGGSGSMDPIESLEGTAITLPECGFTAPEGKVFKCWSIGGVEYNAGASFNMKKNNAKAIWQNVPVTYLDENGVEQTLTDYKVLTGEEQDVDGRITLAGGTYVVNSDINYGTDIYFIEFTSDTTLILCDGKTMTATFKQAGNAYGVDCNGTLTICGQSGGTGKLDIYAYNAPICAENITINGGVIIAKSCFYSAIYAHNIILNGGTVNATGGADSDYEGIRANNDVILGGAEVTVNQYDVLGTVQVKEGLIYGDEDGHIYDSANNLDTEAIAGKTLAPVKPQSLSSGTIASQPVLHIGNSDNILAVQNTYLDGYKFDGFMVGETPCEDMAAVVEAVRNLRTADPNAEITITPKFTQKNEEYTLTIVNGHLKDSTNTTGKFRVSDQLYAVANAPEEGTKFGHWEVEGVLTPVGYDETYAFRMPSKAMTLTAVYVPDDTDVVKEGVGYIERVYKPENGKMSFVSILSIPDGCQMLKAGIVAQKSEVLGTDELTENNARFVRYSDTSANSYSSFKYTWTLTASDDSEWTVRPYLVYIDAQGEHTVYGDPVKYSLNDLT